MKHAMIALIVLPALLAGCSGGSGTSDEATATEPAAGPGSTAAVDDEDLLKQWGPSERPDREAQPLEFFHWRVDELFRRGDADENGKLGFDEFSGEQVNFERIDVNDDGFVTKKEFIDDLLPLMQSTGEIP